MYESFATVWERVADAIPDAIAVVQGARRVSWGDTEQRAARLAAALSAAGVRAGTHVALYLYNCPEYMECLFACSKLRAVPVNVNFRYVADELAFLVDNADAEVLVYHRSLGDRVAAARDRMPQLRVLIEIDDGDEGADVEPVVDRQRYDDLLEGHQPLHRVERSGDDLLLWYTGGTTGMPKGVLWHQGTLMDFGLIGAYALQNQPVAPSLPALIDDVQAFRARGSSPIVLLTTPLVHATAVHQANTAFLVGGTIVLLERGPVDGDEVCATIARERVTVLQTVGDITMRRIVNALEAADARGEPYDLSSVRRVHNSGAMISAPLKDALLARGTMHIYDALGSSEATGFALALASNPGESATARFKLGPTARVLADGDRDVVPGSGERGVLAVRESIATGYYKDPERTASTFRTIGGVPYAIPGDWALLDADGTLTLLGRGSGCINTGGEKVWPEEVEEALKEHPHVADAAVVGLPDDEWGEIVGAVIARVDDAPELTPDSLPTTLSTTGCPIASRDTSARAATWWSTRCDAPAWASSTTSGRAPR